MVRRRRGWFLAAAALGVALAVAVPVAWASDLFGDVPNTNPFHDDIGAIARAGVTKGCDTSTPPNYCPNDNVTRQAMAAFMHRGFGRVAFFASPSELTVPNNPANEADAALWTTSIVPGLPAGALAGAAGFIKGDASVLIRQTDATGCPCEYLAALFVVEENNYLDGNWYSDTTLTNAGDVATIPITGALPVATSGLKHVQIRVFRVLGGSGTVAATASAKATLTYFPFGSTGTNMLAVIGKGKLNGRRSPSPPANTSRR